MKHGLEQKHLYKTAKYLAVGTMLLAGRYVISRLVSRRWGKKLHWASPENSIDVTCPSGNVWYAEFDGTANKQTIVFIHGINANHRQWYYQREHFRNTYRLLFLDMPMHTGKNLSSQLSISILAADLNSVFSQLNIQHAIIYGHSMGGMVLLQYAAQFTSNTNMQAMILQGASYTNPIRTNPFAFLLKPLQQSILIPLFSFIKSNAWFFNLLSYVNLWNGISCLVYRFILFSGNQTANQLLYASAMAPTNDSAAAVESVLQLMRYDVTEQLPHLQWPALIISGIHDRFITVQCNRYLHQQLPQAQLKLINAGHQGMIENHAEVNALTETFIRQVLAVQ
ncbi:alpha/beta hydrolase [Mucilaginibacter robiniae]|uniref:Alpha/beta hydrolase n=1 Tax=Mucilaginibacter robiniae TaxID=2728022 RepID=A0A7L5DXD4_9SPHI|nr:alpha/beta hydrolase [Mucilaginibacter robiniae]QJD94888.1 alpha/beta hydrolase [Mucilaginibacter robiniae]